MHAHPWCGEACLRPGRCLCSQIASRPLLPLPCLLNCLQDFRCFVSAEPIAGAPHARIVPEGLLQSCIKVSNEPPSDIRSNMRAAWGAFSAGGLEEGDVGRDGAGWAVLAGRCLQNQQQQ